MELEHQAPKCSDSDGIVGLTVRRAQWPQVEAPVPKLQLYFPWLPNEASLQGAADGGVVQFGSC